MKTKRGPRIIGIGALGVVGFMIFLALINTPFISNFDSSIQSQEISQGDSGIIVNCDVIDECNDQIDLILGSVIESDEKFTESNDSLFDRWADEFGTGNVSPLVIESAISLIDSNGIEHPTSSFFSPPAIITLVDPDDNPINLGFIQTSVIAISTDGPGQMNLVGRMEFYLDDERIKKRIISTNQFTDQDGKTTMFIGNVALPSFSERSETFTFDLSDEQDGWTPGSTHFYRVVLTEISGSITTNTGSSNFDWKGEQEVYKLEMKFDDQTTVKKEDGQDAEVVFKTDSEIKTCGTGADNWVWTSAKKRLSTLGIDAVPLKIELEDSTIETIPGGKQGNDGGFIGLTVQLGKTDCDKILVQRDQTIKITVNPKDGIMYNKNLPTETIMVDMPKSQKNISLVCTEGGNFAPNGLSKVNCKGTGELADYDVSVFNYYMGRGCAVNQGGTGVSSANCAIQADSYLASDKFKETVCPNKRGCYQDYLDYLETLG